MSIRFESNIFYLETKNSLYQMKVDKYGVLLHLWYGSRTYENMDYLLDYPDVGFSGSIYDAGNDRAYSLDTLPLEYACFGNGDYRVPAISVLHADGSNALDLRYVVCEIERGKYNIPGLPAVYGNEEDAETLSITLKDVASDIYVILKYGVFYDDDIITRSVVVKNMGKEEVFLNRVHSLSLDITRGDLEWMHFYGRHTMERMVERKPLFHGIQEIGSTRGTTSHQQNPTVIICDESCNETSGFCIGAALMYSGGFQMQLELDQLNQTRIVMGINPETFSWRLKSGEIFYTPEVILSCSNEGMAKLSHNFHNIIRNHVCRGKYKLIERPVLINNWEATYFDFTEEKIYEIAREAKALGVEMLVLDDGWFGKRDNDSSGLGDWYVNENKLKGGLSELAIRINSLGMKFGIWLEPEMVSEDSDLYREHPDWVIKIPERNPIRGRFQLVLDLTRADVRDYLFDAIAGILESANVEYIKWDMNRSISDWYSGLLLPNEQGEAPHRYVLGLYELLERLNEAYPDVLLEGCSGGGGRFDAGMLYYCPQIWCSDDTDAFERTKIQYGTSFFYPASTIGSHVSAVPNHQTGRVTSLAARGVTAMHGSFGYELDLSELTEEEKEQITMQIKTFKKYGSLIHDGDYYRLSNPFKENFAIWEYVSKDKSQALLHGMIYHTEANMLRYKVRLMGLLPEKSYRLKGTDNIYTGAALMKGGILLPASTGDYFAVEMMFEEI